MSERIVQLTASDFDEAMDLLNYAFGYSHGPHDFPALLPKLYRPTDRHMRCNYAIRRRGMLAAAVGVFPIVWHVGGAALRVAGVGGVSTHPRYRGSGLMTTLMRHCVEEIRASGYPLSVLSGRRRRYRRFGYEQCGTELLFTLERDDPEAAGAGGTGIEFRRLTAGDPLLADAQRLHDGQRMRCERPPAEFVAICSSWNNRPYAAVARAELAGYLIADGNGSTVTELLASDEAETLRIAAAWCAHRNLDSVTVAASPARLALVRQLDAIAQSTTLRSCDNWQVFDWPAALTALLGERARSGDAESGSLVLRIGDAGRLRLSVDGSAPAALAAATSRRSAASSRSDSRRPSATSPARNAARKASPQPVVSTTSAAKPGTWPQARPSSYQAPPPPPVIRHSLTPRSSRRWQPARRPMVPASSFSSTSLSLTTSAHRNAGMIASRAACSPDQTAGR